MPYGTQGAFGTSYVSPVKAFNEGLMGGVGTIMQVREMQRKEKEMEMMEKYRQSQEAMMQEQMATAQLKRQQEAEEISGQRNLRGNVNMPGLMSVGIVDPVTRSSDPVAMKQVAMGQTPEGMTSGQLREPTLQQIVDEQIMNNPTEGIKSRIALAGQEKKEPPVIAALRVANANGTITDQGLALLNKYEGMDLYQGKKELKPGVEEKYDPKTKSTFGRDFVQNQQSGEKTYVGDWRPIKGRESTTINMQAPAKEDVEVMAQLLAEGKINTTDISKRGGNQQLAAILRRAKEINPGLDPRANMADTSGYVSAITSQQKQLGAMGSFVKNMEYQVNKVEELAKELKTFDTRLLNVPLRALRGKIAGSPLQAKYDMYVTEIENEIGKLATGSAASVAELTQGAQEKWAKIHDKNLSIPDMVSLLKETASAGKLRMKSVSEQLKETKAQMRSRGQGVPEQGTTPNTNFRQKYNY
jgi:hypothetical protein